MSCGIVEFQTYADWCAQPPRDSQYPGSKLMNALGVVLQVNKNEEGEGSEWTEHYQGVLLYFPPRFSGRYYNFQGTAYRIDPSIKPDRVGIAMAVHKRGTVADFTFKSGSILNGFFELDVESCNDDGYLLTLKLSDFESSQRIYYTYTLSLWRSIQIVIA